MSYDEYWNADSFLIVSFYKAHQLRIEQRNQELWLQGLYNYKALNVVAGNALGKGKRDKYFEKPVDIFPKTERQKEQEAQAEREKIINGLTAWKRDWDRSHKGGDMNSGKN